MLTDADCILIVTKVAKIHDVTVEEVMSLMMSPEDLEDLKNGDILFEALKLHVKVWCEMGKLNKNSNYGFP